MNRNSSKSPRNLRGAVLTAAIVSALGLGVAAPASANGSFVLSGAAPTVTLEEYMESLVNGQSLSDLVDARTRDVAIGYAGPASGAPLTVQDNTIQAATLDATTGLAGANGADNSVDLALLGSDGVSEGIGILSSQFATGDGAIARVREGDIGLDLIDQSAGDVAVTGNTTTASALVNAAGNRIAGGLEAFEFDGLHNDAAFLDYSNISASLDTGGVLSIGNAQVNATDAASARVVDSDTVVVNIMTAPGSSAAGIVVGDNNASASAGGNQADNRILAAAGGSVAYTGFATVANGQLNDGADVRARVTDTDMGAELQDTTYTGQASIAGNRISASAQANDAGAVDGAGGMARGNAIVFDAGVDVSGPDGDATAELEFGAFGAGQVDLDGDIALLNGQGNWNNLVTGRVNLSEIGFRADTLAGGSVAIDDNSVSASAGGNDAITLASAGGSSFDAAVVAASQQGNENAVIRARADEVAIALDATGGAPHSGGQATVSGNAITAAADGNRAQTLVDIDAANVSAAAGTDGGLGGDASGFGALSTLDDAGIVAMNLQGNFDDDGRVIARVAEGAIAAGFAGDLVDSEVTVAGNAVSANATGNAGLTSVALGGAEGAVSAAVGSGQYNASRIRAVVEEMSMGVYVDGDLQDDMATISGNSATAGATANRSDNRLSADFSGGLAVMGTGTGAQSDVNSNEADAPLALLNNQDNDHANVISAAGFIDLSVLGEDDMRHLGLAVTGNAVSASGTGNATGNAIDVAAGHLDAGGGSIAALSNMQRMTGSVEAAVGEVYISVDNDDTLDGGSVATVADNSVTAFAGGNLAGGDGGQGNVLRVSGSGLAAPGMAVGLVSNDTTGEQSAAAGFVLNSSQESGIDGSDVRSASVGVATIDVYADGIEDSTLAVTGNDIIADARDNYADNTVAFDGFSSLATTSGLQNTQHSRASLVSGVLFANIGVDAGGLDNAATTVSGNAVAAKAIANTAANALSIRAANLSGNGTTTLGGGVPAEYRGAGLLGDDVLVVADHAMSNAQFQVGDIVTTAGQVSIGAGAEGGDITGQDHVVSDNTMTVLAQANSASNRVDLGSAQVDASAAIMNRQDSISFVSAIGGLVWIASRATGDMTEGATFTVAGNAVAVSAGQNDAATSLVVDASNGIAGSVGTAGASDHPTAFLGYTGAIADYAVANKQDADGGVMSILSDVIVGAGAGDGIGDGVLPMSIAVEGNSVDAQASGNHAANAVVLQASGSIGATAAIGSEQTLDSFGPGVSAMVELTSVSAVAATGDAQQADLVVSGNRVAANASGNSVGNAIEVGAAVLNAAPVGTFAVTEGGNGGVAANYAINSAQDNAAAINAQAFDIDIGTSTPGAMAGGTAAVSGNAVMASASANSASNSILLASASGMPSAALASNQVNIAAVTATIDSATIGISVGPLSNSPATITGNVISATAVGNAAINHIGVGN